AQPDHIGAAEITDQRYRDQGADLGRGDAILAQRHRQNHPQHAIGKLADPAGDRDQQGVPRGNREVSGGPNGRRVFHSRVLTNGFSSILRFAHRPQSGDRTDPSDLGTYHGRRAATNRSSERASSSSHTESMTCWDWAVDKTPSAHSRNLSSSWLWLMGFRGWPIATSASPNKVRPSVNSTVTFARTCSKPRASSSGSTSTSTRSSMA